MGGYQARLHRYVGLLCVRTPESWTFWSITWPDSPLLAQEATSFLFPWKSWLLLMSSPLCHQP